MQTAALDLAEGEASVANYPYKDLGGRHIELMLTTSRLVSLSAQHRNDIPLERLQSIRVERVRNMGIVLALSFGMVLSLVCAAVFGYTIFLQTANAPVFMKTVPIGMLVIGLILLYGLIRGGFSYTRIVIGLDANTLQYELPASDEALLDFVRRVEDVTSRR